ncbi:MAG: hypothetical protein NTV73_06965 [Hyphomicrobiales bacterium]|nr:hypothetical protein [Hyphomicrobiales bacterium]
MAHFRLLTPDAQYADDGLVERRTAGDDVDWDILRERSSSRLGPETLAACDAMVVWHEMRVDRTMLGLLKKCRIIVRAGVGFDHIDLDAAARLGIPVCNTPDYGTSEVADHASPESVADARRLSVETAMLYLRDGKLRNLVNVPSPGTSRGAA